MSFQEISLNIHKTVNRIAAVYETFGISQDEEGPYKEEAKILRSIANEGILAEEGVVRLIDRVPAGVHRSGGWVFTLATMLGFSFEGIALKQLSIREGVEIKHGDPGFPCRAILIEGFIDDENIRWNSFTLTMDGGSHKKTLKDVL